jgi:hypothetical protein
MQRPLIPSLALLFILPSTASAQVTSIGLSAVRAQRFGNDFSPTLVPQDDDHFASSLAVGDFDGDGADDLATGMPDDDGEVGSEVLNAGLVVIRYGASGGGLGAEIQLLRQSGGGLEPGDRFGFALASCDFDGDGFDDLAVGTPFEDVFSVVAAGAVFVFHGTSVGLETNILQLFTQDNPGLPDSSEAFDWFGAALACADFDADGFDDLAVGAPGESSGSFGSAGAVFGLTGAVGGLVPSFGFGQDLQAGPSHEFGRSLAAGDWNGDGFGDLAAGAPGADSDRGALEVRFGSAVGIGLAGLSLTETDIGGLSEAFDFFAFSLAGADFDGDGRDDLAVGIPREDFGVGGSVLDCGQLNVLYGAPGGFDFGRTQFWAQDNILGAGTSEAGDLFSLAMAAGDFDRDGRDDLAIGAPGEFVLGPEDGAATVIMGSPAGLTADRHRGIAAGLGGFPGDATQHNRQFSFSLAAGDFDADGHADLAIGAPLEDENGVVNTGAEIVLYGALFADGFETGDATLWSATSP